MNAPKRTATGRTLPLGWAQPEGTLPERTRPEGTQPALNGTAAPRRRPGFALAGAIGAVLVLLLALPVLLLGGSSAEDPVREYLDALVAGDVATVREHLTATVDASDIALREDVLRAAAGRVDSYTIDAVHTDGRQATVTASLSSGTRVQQTSFTVRSQAVSSFVPATWELLPVAAAEFVVTVPEGVRELLINRVPIPLSGQPQREGMYGQQLLTLRLLPGSYDLELPGRSARLIPIAEQVSVPMHTGELRRAGAVMGYELSAQGRAEVTALVDAVLEECAAATTSTPPECPFAAVTDDRPGSPGEGAEVIGAAEPSAALGTWQVTAPASYQIDRWISPSWSITSDIGQAVFTSAPGADGSAGTSQIVPFLIDGLAMLDASGELHLQLSESYLLNVVTCVDAEDGSSTTTWQIEEEAVVICQGEE